MKARNGHPGHGTASGDAAQEAHASSNVGEVLADISDAFFALDGQWRFIYVNQAAERLLLRRSAELLGNSIWEEFPSAVGSTFFHEYHRAVAEGVTVQFEEYYPPLEGWFSVRAYPTSAGLAVYFQNINERRRREEELQRVSERAHLAALAVEGLIYDADLVSGTVLRSEGLYSLVGYRPDEVEPTIAWWRERVHPDDRQEWLYPGTGALDDPTMSQYEAEYRVRHRDGRYLWVWDRALIFRNEKGRPVRLVGSTFDITARRLAEEKLRESEERHRIISELTSDYNFALHVHADGSSRLDLVTEGFTRVTGYTLDEVNAMGGWAALIHPDDLDEATQGYRRVLTGQVNVSVVRILTKQGEVRWLRSLNKPVRGTDDSPVIGIVGAAQDVTEHRQAEEELRESRQRLQLLSRLLIAAQENERRRLAHELHDEIGQTLTAISITLQAAQLASGEAAQLRLREATAIVDRAIEQVRHLSLDLRPSLLDDLGLEAALRWSVDRQTQRTGLAVYLDATLGGLRLGAELETACFRVAQEALTNVARHAGARRVWIELQLRDAVVNLSVRDDGVGFDPLAARALAAKGTSFGLLGMQERVELLGGKFTVRSRPGHGTSIRAQFPLAATSPRREVGMEINDDETDPDLASR